MTPSRSMVILLSAGVLTGATYGYAAAPANVPPGGKGGRVRLSGTVDSVEADVIKVTVGDGQKLSLTLGKKGKIRIAGKAERGCLKPGVHLQFAALVDKKTHRVKNPVDKLLIYTPSNSLYPGLISDPSPAAAAAAADAADLRVSWKPYIVSGFLVSFDGKKLTINVPNYAPRLTVEVAADLHIDFDVDDLSVVQAGDAIRVAKGQQAGDRVTVVDATIKRRAPLENWAKKGAGPTPVGRGGAKPK